MVIEVILIKKIFIIAFFINLLWELVHSQLYDTCLKMKLKPYTKLIIKMSLIDAFMISLIYLITALIFKNYLILNSPIQLITYSILALLFVFIDEKIAIKNKRWKYSKKMPTIFGVGITPLIELFLTGIITFLIIF